mmetsp:Transcript_57273/g.125367  ORF Transcript_57273/g.125367 Transcript_57273/m.125367 type:complete len:125 (-) Transcript_57273:116-490(-)
MYLLRGIARARLPARWTGLVQEALAAKVAPGVKLPRPMQPFEPVMPLQGREFILPAPEELVEEGGTVEVDPLLCNQPWYRRRLEQRNALKKVENASKFDCGPFKKHWRWWRDRKIKARKKKRVI